MTSAYCTKAFLRSCGLLIVFEESRDVRKTNFGFGRSYHLCGLPSIGGRRLDPEKGSKHCESGDCSTGQATKQSPSHDVGSIQLYSYRDEDFRSDTQLNASVQARGRLPERGGATFSWCSLAAACSSMQRVAQPTGSSLTTLKSTSPARSASTVTVGHAVETPAQFRSRRSPAPSLQHSLYFTHVV